MKLNKNGWGLRTEIIFLLIFVICLLIFFVGAKEFGLWKVNEPGKNDNKTEENFNYEDLEEKLEASALKYVEDVYNNELGLDTLILKASVLKSNGYLTDYVDEKGKDCSGYAEVYIDGESGIVYIPYVKCGSKYETEGYLERKDN